MLISPVGYLPGAPSPLIGREYEASAVQNLLSTHRIVTLTGAGGSGKTRLSLKVAANLCDDFPEGAWFIEFAPLEDPALVPQAVASVLGIPEPKKRLLADELIRHLRNSHALLILDNCEHLLDACAQLAEALLRDCPEIRVLVTSREPLGIAGEVVWTVPPLSLPELQPGQPPDGGDGALPAYQQSEAVQLFVSRASSVLPGFTLTSDNAAWISEICRRLDGMPLAIELAAARVRALSVRQIAERLDDRFHLLTGGHRTAPARQQTLAAALDWSYDLLSDTERLVLQRSSVFWGSTALPAIEFVCAGEGIDAEDVFDTVSHLVDKSLVIANQSCGETRYHLLETIRQYAHEKLIDSGAHDTMQDRHLEYFIRWTAEAEPHLWIADQLLWLDRFEAEHDNLRAALNWSAKDEGRAESGLRLAAACGRFWRLHAHFTEGRARLAAAMSSAAVQTPTAARATALTYASNLAYLQSDYPAMQPMAEEAVPIWRGLGSAGKRGLGYTLTLLGELATERGDYDLAFAYFQEALQHFRDLKDETGISDVLMQFGWASMRTGDYRQARSYLEEFQALSRAAGHQTNLAFSYSGLGELSIRQKQYKEAVSLLQQGLSLSRDIGDTWGIATMLGSLGWAALRQRDFTRTRSYLRESLEMRARTGDQGGTAWCLEKLAEAAWLQKRPQDAAELFGAAAALRAPICSVIDPADRPDYEHMLSDLRSALGPAAFTAAWQLGASRSCEHTIRVALADSAGPSPDTERDRYGGLSAREREVAILIAQGRPNREIAQEMTVGLKTIETYVTRILHKLGFVSRVQIATWAMEAGLSAPDEELRMRNARSTPTYV